MLTQNQIDTYKDKNLSEHFTLWECIKSEHLDLIINTPEDIVQNLSLGCQMMLEPLRQYLGKPVKINSGWRSIAINRKIGGSESSDHLLGTAFDIDGGGTLGSDMVYKWFISYGYYRQLIIYPTRHFVHVSYNHPSKSFKKEAFEL